MNCAAAHFRKSCLGVFLAVVLRFRGWCWKLSRSIRGTKGLVPWGVVEGTTASGMGECEQDVRSAEPRRLKT
jgi:hypothetical protein